MVCNSRLDAQAYCDQQTGGVLAYNGDDAIDLVCSGVVVDVTGRIGEDPGAEWGRDEVTTKEHTLLRNCDVEVGDPEGRDPFHPAEEWTGLPQDTFDDLGVWHCLAE